MRGDRRFCRAHHHLNAGRHNHRRQHRHSTTNFDWGLLEIDPATGNRTIISDSTHGTGPAIGTGTGFPGIGGISFQSDGSMLVTWNNGSAPDDESAISRRPYNRKPDPN